MFNSRLPKKEEELKAVEVVNNFFIEYEDCFINRMGYPCDLSDYLRGIEKSNLGHLYYCKLLAMPLYSVEVLKKHKENIVFYQTGGEAEDGLVTFVLQFSKKAHAVVGVYWVFDGDFEPRLFTKVFYIYKDIKDFNTFVRENKDLEIYVSEQQQSGGGMGFGG